MKITDKDCLKKNDRAELRKGTERASGTVENIGVDAGNLGRVPPSAEAAPVLTADLPEGHTAVCLRGDHSKATPCSVHPVLAAVFGSESAP